MTDKEDHIKYDLTCAINGDLIVKEMTFEYAAPRWDPRVMD